MDRTQQWIMENCFVPVTDDDIFDPFVDESITEAHCSGRGLAYPALSTLRLPLKLQLELRLTDPTPGFKKPGVPKLTKGRQTEPKPGESFACQDVRYQAKNIPSSPDTIKSSCSGRQRPMCLARGRRLPSSNQTLSRPASVSSACNEVNPTRDDELLPSGPASVTSSGTERTKSRCRGRAKSKQDFNVPIPGNSRSKMAWRGASDASSLTSGQFDNADSSTSAQSPNKPRQCKPALNQALRNKTYTHSSYSVSVEGIIANPICGSNKLYSEEKSSKSMANVDVKMDSPSSGNSKPSPGGKKKKYTKLSDSPQHCIDLKQIICKHLSVKQGQDLVPEIPKPDHSSSELDDEGEEDEDLYHHSHKKFTLFEHARTDDGKRIVFEKHAKLHSAMPTFKGFTFSHLNTPDTFTMEKDFPDIIRSNLQSEAIVKSKLKSKTSPKKHMVTKTSLKNVASCILSDSKSKSNEAGELISVEPTDPDEEGPEEGPAAWLRVSNLPLDRFCETDFMDYLKHFGRIAEVQTLKEGESFTYRVKFHSVSSAEDAGECLHGDETIYIGHELKAIVEEETAECPESN